jgi:hypothetical protein
VENGISVEKQISGDNALSVEIVKQVTTDSSSSTTTHPRIDIPPDAPEISLEIRSPTATPLGKRAHTKKPSQF